MQFLRFTLFPFALLFGIITGIRNFFFDTGLFKSHKPGIPVIGVGNLSVGGTGKSTMVEYLVRLLRGKKSCATLSRGYKRKTKGFVEASLQSGISEVGDEPRQFKQKFPDIVVAVCEDRATGVNRLREKHPLLQCVILDDAFQHRKIKPGLQIMLTEYRRPYFKDFVFPVGNLLEWRSGKKRADIIVVTKCPKNISPVEQEKIINRINPRKDQKVFFSYLKYSQLLSFDTHKPIPSDPSTSVLLVTGIANPEPLAGYLRRVFRHVAHLEFEDNKYFDEPEFDKIRGRFNALGGAKKIIITTEKDAARMEHPGFKNLPVYYLPIECSFVSKEEEFNQLVLDFSNYKKP
jgi:tetraacyldisaccharide 4'-kinase